MLYRKIILPFFSRLNPKNARTIIYRCLNFLNRFRITRYLIKLLFYRSFPSLKKEVFGIKFTNPLGLGSGFDINAEYCDIISSIGLAFVEVGPLTPLPEKNPPFENKGVLAAISNLKKVRTSAIIAADVAYNSSSTEDEIGSEMEKSIAMLYDFVDMFVINATLPSAETERSPLEDPETLEDVMDTVLEGRMSMDSMKPILIKLDPGIAKDQLNAILDYSMRSGVDGIVAGYADSHHGRQFHFTDNLEFIRYISSYTKGRLEIIGCGGILRPEGACEMLEAGASLVELYTGLFKEGPRLVRKTLKYLEDKNSKGKNDD